MASADDLAHIPGTIRDPTTGSRIATVTADNRLSVEGTFVQTTAANLLGIVQLETNFMGVAGVSTAPKFAVINTSSSAGTSVVAAVTAKKIRVVSMDVMASAAVNVKFQNAALDITGLAYLAANGGIVRPYNPAGWFETTANSALNIHLSGAVPVGGCVTYVEV